MSALKSWKFTADRVYNIDKPGVSTNVQSPNLVVQIGRKQDGQAVSGEQGTMITVCHHHHHKHQVLDPLICSVSRVTAACANASSVFQLLSFLVVCSGMISKGFGFVALFTSVKASSVCIHLTCLVCLQSAY